MKLTFKQLSEHRWYLTDGEYMYYTHGPIIASWGKYAILPEELHRRLWHLSFDDGEAAYAMLMAAKIRGEW